MNDPTRQLRRRTLLAATLSAAGLALGAPVFGRAMAAELGWSDAQTADEIAEVDRFYEMPD